MENRAISTRTLVRALWRAKWFVLLCVVLCTVAAVIAVALLMPPKYSASVVFLLKGSEEPALVESGIYILQTRQTLDAVLDQAGNVCSREELADMLEAKALGDTPMLEVTVRHGDAQIAKTLADAVTVVLPQRLSDLMQGVQVEVADVPELPRRAEGPNFVLVGLLGLLIGMAVPVAVVTVREYGKVVV